MSSIAPSLIRSFRIGRRRFPRRERSGERRIPTDSPSPFLKTISLQHSKHAAAALAACLFAILLAGCGVPGEPLPPLLEIPARVTDLGALQVDARIHLAWSPPRLTTEGTRVRRLDRMELYAAFLSPKAPLANFAAQSHLVATIPANGVPPAQRVTYDVSLHSGEVGQKAVFAVKAFNRKGKDAGFSNLVSVEIANLPQPPSDLKAQVTQKAVRLSWKPAAASVFGGPAPKDSAYQVFRAGTRPVEPPQQIGTSKTLSYRDTSFAFGHTYTYFLRAFVRQGASTAITSPSPSVEVAAKDVFPPAAPRNVRAIAVPGAVELSWSPNSESDLAGYNVYRSAGGAFARLNRQLLLVPIFRDAGIEPAKSYVYRITAVDKNGNESVPSKDTPITMK